MDFEAIRVDLYPIDEELSDSGHVGPELAAQAAEYLATPRALVWRNPSSDWRLFVLMMPLASRLSLMTNPIFAQLARDWGHNVRFVGIDRDHRVMDFRELLSDQTLRKLVAALARWLAETGQPSAQKAEHATLDVLFAALADNMLTLLEARRSDWMRHLACEHRLEPGAPGSLFDRESRFPDFLARLRLALRTGVIDVPFYSRVLRSIDLREASAEQRMAALIEASLEPVTLASAARTRAGQHLGAYNWLLAGQRHLPQRAYLLSRLPAFAQSMAELAFSSLSDPNHPNHPNHFNHTSHGSGPPTLQAAIDSGQDRAIIEALADHFGVQPNVMRALWRHCPRGLASPAGWHLRLILRRLNDLPERAWPRSDEAWQQLASQSVPV